jgi:hypothetical protein
MAPLGYPYATCTTASSPQFGQIVRVGTDINFLRQVSDSAAGPDCDGRRKASTCGRRSQRKFDSSEAVHCFEEDPVAAANPPPPESPPSAPTATPPVGPCPLHRAPIVVVTVALGKRVRLPRRVERCSRGHDHVIAVVEGGQVAMRVQWRTDSNLAAALLASQVAQQVVRCRRGAACDTRTSAARHRFVGRWLLGWFWADGGFRRILYLSTAPVCGRGVYRVTASAVLSTMR